MSSSTNTQSLTPPTIEGKLVIAGPAGAVNRKCKKSTREVEPQDTHEAALADVRTERSRQFVRALVTAWPQLNGKWAALSVGCNPKSARRAANEWRSRPGANSY